MSKELPQEFQHRKFGEVVSLKYGSALSEKVRTAGEYPVFGSNGAIGMHQEYLVEGPGIIVGRKGSVGSINWTEENFWPIDTTYYVKPLDGHNLRWVFYLLKSLNLESLSLKSGVPGLNRADVYRLRVELPCYTVQARIVEILSSIDEALEASKAVLEQLVAVKRKLSYELFTKDLTTSAPGRYVKHFGEVPRGWCLTTLGELSSFVTSGPRGWAKYYAEQGAAYMRIGDLAKHSIDLELGSTQHVDPPENAEGVRTQLRPDDLLISITADLGITNIAPEDIGKTFINQHIALVRIKKGSANPRCLAYWFQLGPGNRQFKRLSDQGAKSGLNLTSIRSMKVALPSLEAQKTIVEALDLIEHNVALCKKKISAIESLKRGLMQQLLTGKLRVAVDDG